MTRRLLQSIVVLLLFLSGATVSLAQSLPIELFDKNARDLMPDADLLPPDPGDPISTPILPEIAFPEYDFRATKWGDTIDSVIDSEQREGYELIPEEQSTRLVYKEVRFEGVYCTLKYVFLDGRLWCAEYLIPDERNLFSKIIKKLESRYGNPEDEMQGYVWYASPIISLKLYNDVQKAKTFINLSFLAGSNSSFF